MLGYPFAIGDRHHQGDAAAGDGQGRPAGRHLRPASTRATARPASSARCYESDPDVKRVVDTARGLEGLKRQWGVHAAGVIMSSEPLLDLIPIMKREQDGAIITQFDYPTCETLGLLKMDFLGLRNLTDPRRRAAQHRGQPRRSTRRPGGPHARRPADLRAAVPRRHPRASSSSTAGRCARCCGSMRPDNFEDISAVGALYRPGPMGAELAQRTTPTARTAASRSRRSTPSWPSRWPTILGDDLRPDRLPGAGHGDRAEARRLLARRGRPAAPGDGQEEEARCSTPSSSAFSAGMTANGYSDGRDQDAVGHPASRSPTTRSTRRTPRPTGWCPTGRPTSRPTTRPSTWRPCSPASRDDKDKSALYLNECRRMGIKVLPPDVNESDADFTAGRHRHPVRAVRDPQRRRQRGRLASSAARTEQGPRSPTSTTSCARSTPVVCNKKTVESLIKAGAFDSLGHPRRGLLDGARRGHRRVRRTPSATRRIGQFDLFGELTTTADGVATRHRDAAGAAGRVGQDGAARLRARDARASTCPTTRCSGSSTCSPRPADCSIASLTGSDGPRGRLASSPSAGLVSGLQRKVTKKGDVWAIATLEDLEGAIEVMFFPQTYQLFATSLAEDAVVVDQGPARPARRRAQADRDGADRCPTCPRARAARSSSRCRSRGAPRRWSSGSRRCWPPTRAPPRCTCGCSRRRAPRCCGSTTGCGSPRRRR